MILFAANRGNFSQEVLESSLPVLVDFWAPWCGPCQALGPILAEIAKEARRFRIAKVNVDEEPELAQRYLVSSIPTLLVFRKGEAVRRSVGLLSKAEVLALLE